MTTLLQTIIETKARRLEEAKRDRPLAMLLGELRLPEPRSFRQACSPLGRVNIIAEVKRASPSGGILRREFDPVSLAAEYEAHGAVAVSVLTEEDYFLGSLEHLREIRRRVRLPLLRKDFIFDPYQVYESAAAGADAILLIAAVLDHEQLFDLRQVADELGLDALVEVHTPMDLEKALAAGATLIGVNNRDLRTFEVTLDVSLDLARSVPNDVLLVSESGIRTRRDIDRLRQAGYRAFLIGEHFMRAEQPGRALKQLLEPPGRQDQTTRGDGCERL